MVIQNITDMNSDMADDKKMFLITTFKMWMDVTIMLMLKAVSKNLALKLKYI